MEESHNIKAVNISKESSGGQPNSPSLTGTSSVRFVWGFTPSCLKISRKHITNMTCSKQFRARTLSNWIRLVTSLLANYGQLSWGICQLQPMLACLNPLSFLSFSFFLFFLSLWFHFKWLHKDLHSIFYCDSWPVKLKYLWLGTLQQKFADSWTKWNKEKTYY